MWKQCVDYLVIYEVRYLSTGFADAQGITRRLCRGTVVMLMGIQRVRYLYWRKCRCLGNHMEITWKYCGDILVNPWSQTSVLEMFYNILNMIWGFCGDTVVILKVIHGVIYLCWISFIVIFLSWCVFLV